MNTMKNNEYKDKQCKSDDKQKQAVNNNAQDHERNIRDDEN